jgi:hypothetical protein
VSLGVAVNIAKLPELFGKQLRRLDDFDWNMRE